MGISRRIFLAGSALWAWIKPQKKRPVEKKPPTPWIGHW